MISVKGKNHKHPLQTVSSKPMSSDAHLHLLYKHDGSLVLFAMRTADQLVRLLSLLIIIQVSIFYQPIQCNPIKNKL